MCVCVCVCVCVCGLGFVVTGVEESLTDFTALPNCRLILITAPMQPSNTYITNNSSTNAFI